MESTQSRPLVDDLIAGAQSLGEFIGRAESWHRVTCSPPDPKCPGCRASIERHVKRVHLGMAYTLFGWDAAMDSLIRSLDLKIEQRDANLSIGAGI